jgi:hypothetical protein
LIDRHARLGLRSKASAAARAAALNVQGRVLMTEPANDKAVNNEELVDDLEATDDEAEDVRGGTKNHINFSRSPF